MLKNIKYKFFIEFYYDILYFIFVIKQVNIKLKLHKMAKYSFISDFKCQKRGIYEGENLVVPFLSEAQTKEKHNLYVYAQIKEEFYQN